jgi:hypothetical protein
MTPRLFSYPSKHRLSLLVLWIAVFLPLPGNNHAFAEGDVSWRDEMAQD